jgi:Type VI secretion system/phage-baseplate injector OB domain
MSEDKRFYGIYEGVCTNNQDPDGKYKIKLQVYQVLGYNETEWAPPCLPVVNDANHLDHQAHTAAQIAALLTTTSVSITGTGTDSAVIGSSVTTSATVPALTVVAKSGGGTLNHPHVTSTDSLDTDGSEIGLSAAEHTYHRKVPNVGQKVWVMFIAGDPNFPVWMGVQL